MADNEQAGRTELHDARPRREGHRAGEVRRRLPRRGHAVRQAAAQPDAARARDAASTRARRWRCPASRRSSPPTICRRRPTASPTSAKTIQANAKGERALTNEPLYEGEPILAVAAVDELTAAEAIERIQIEFEPLPFVVDPLVSLRPGGPNARTEGNVWMRPAAAPPRRRPAGAAPAASGDPGVEVDRRRTSPRPTTGQLPMGKPPDEVVVRRPRGRLQERGARPRRDLRRRRTPAISRSRRARRWPTGRTASSTCTADAEHRADRRRRRALGRHRRRRTSSSSASTPAAASAARSPARSRW